MLLLLCICARVAVPTPRRGSEDMPPNTVATNDSTTTAQCGWVRRSDVHQKKGALSPHTHTPTHRQTTKPFLDREKQAPESHCTSNGSLTVLHCFWVEMVLSRLGYGMNSPNDEWRRVANVSVCAVRYSHKRACVLVDS